MGETRQCTHHDARRECSADVYVGNARVDVHADRLAVLDKDLLKEHPRDLTRLDVGVRHEVAFGAVWCRPAQSEALFLGRSRLHEHKAGARHLWFDAPTQRLCMVYQRESQDGRRSL